MHEIGEDESDGVGEDTTSGDVDLNEEEEMEVVEEGVAVEEEEDADYEEALAIAMRELDKLKSKAGKLEQKSDNKPKSTKISTEAQVVTEAAVLVGLEGKTSDVNASNGSGEVAAKSPNKRVIPSVDSDVAYNKSAVYLMNSSGQPVKKKKKMQ
jgi:hypothetical protein